MLRRKIYFLLYLLILTLSCDVTAQSFTLPDSLRWHERKIGKSEVPCFIDTNSQYYKTIYGPDRTFFNEPLKNGMYRQYFIQDTTKVAAELVYLDGALTKFRTFWFSDTLHSEFSLVGGYLEGECTSYFPNGRMESKFIYVHGVHNEFYFFYPTGQLKRHSRFVETKGDKSVDDVEDFYSNGQLMQKGQILGGYLTGVWTFCNIDGSICEKKKYKKLDHWLGPADWIE